MPELLIDLDVWEEATKYAIKQLKTMKHQGGLTRSELNDLIYNCAVPAQKAKNRQEGSNGN